MELTFHVQINNIPDRYLSDDQYDFTMQFVKHMLQEVAEGLEGTLYDVEMG
jgi:hypothetical protein